MLVDIIALILLVVAVFKGLRNGLILALFSLIALIVGLAAALKLSVLVAGYLGNSISVSSRWLPVIAFFLVFLVVVLAVRLGARMLEGVAKMAMLGWLNRLGGVVFYILIYFFVFSILLFYAHQLNLIRPETISSSSTYPYIEPIGPKVMDIIGSVIPIFKDMFGKLLHFFQNVADKNHSAQYSFRY